MWGNNRTHSADSGWKNQKKVERERERTLKIKLIKLDAF